MYECYGSAYRSIEFHHKDKTEVSEIIFSKIKRFLNPIEKSNNYDENPVYSKNKNFPDLIEGVFHKYHVSPAEFCCLRHIIEKDFLN